MSLQRQGSKNPSYKSDKASAFSLHQYIRRRKPKPNPDLCEECRTGPTYDLAFLLHPQKYTRNPDDYRWLCRSCHWKFDYANGTRAGVRHTEETKRRIGQNHPDQSGERNPMFGKKLSMEHIQKIREGHLGKKLSEEHLQVK